MSGRFEESRPANTQGVDILDVSRRIVISIEQNRRVVP